MNLSIHPRQRSSARVSTMPLPARCLQRSALPSNEHSSAASHKPTAVI